MLQGSRTRDRGAVHPRAGGAAEILDPEAVVPDEETAMPAADGAVIQEQRGLVAPADDAIDELPGIEDTRQLAVR